MSDETKPKAGEEKPGTAADVVQDESGRKLRDAQSHAAGLEKKLQDLTAEKDKADKIIAELSKLPAQGPVKSKSLLDEICEFLGIES